MRGLLFILIALISVPLLWISIAAIKNTIIEQNNAKKVQAKVIGHVAQTGAGGTVYQTQVEFRLPSGQLIQFTDPVGTYPADHLPGERVWVYYPETEPWKAYIYSFKRTYLVPMILLIVGLLPIILAIWMIRKFSL